MSQSVQRPSAGRIVMFDSPDREQLGHFDGPVPAMITAVRGSTTVDLTIFRNMAQPLLLADVEFSDDPTAGMRWFWPPRA